MDNVKSYDHLLAQIESIKAKNLGYITNFYCERKKATLWIQHNLLFYLFIDDTLFIIKQNEEFLALYYITTDLEQLEYNLGILRNKIPQKTLVVDIIGNKNYSMKIESAFFKNSYINYSTLCRMSRVISDEEPDCSSIISYATPEDASTIKLLLKQYFDPLCEQIPQIEELEEWIYLKHLLVYKEDDKILGFLIFDLIGYTSYLRYWFTNPTHRDKKIGSQLLRSFFAKCNSSKRQLFWVLENNQNAIKRYEHYGFVFENMYDKVLINKI